MRATELGMLVVYDLLRLSYRADWSPNRLASRVAHARERIDTECAPALLRKVAYIYEGSVFKKGVEELRKFTSFLCKSFNMVVQIERV